MDDWVIELRGVSKSYSLEHRPWARLWEQLRGDRQRSGPVPAHTAVESDAVQTQPQTQHHALHHIDLTVRRGEVLGIIGRNGAGKSTLLQVVAGVLQPSRGQRQVRGRIAALLELGAGFNPELTGRENVRFNAPLLGFSKSELQERLPEIIEFAGIGAFIDQPVRSYSSGMFVRLAFSMATCLQPEILIIDEALSVGDGAFARKSYERIMALREVGTTILFCSHSMFQVESICSRAIWLESGRIRFDGPAHQATIEYSEWVQRQEQGHGDLPAQTQHFETAAAAVTRVVLQPPSDGVAFRNRADTLTVIVDIRSEPTSPCPTLGVVLHGADGRAVASVGNWLDAAPLQRDADGQSSVTLQFPDLPLLKGRYTLSAYVLCERAIHLHAAAEHVARFEVVQDHVEQGVVSLPHRWLQGGAA